MSRTKKIKIILEKHLINFEIIVTDNSKSHAGHGNFDGPVHVYHTAYEYSVPDDKKDFKPQFEN